VRSHMDWWAAGVSGADEGARGRFGPEPSGRCQHGHREKRWRDMPRKIVPFYFAAAAHKRASCELSVGDSDASIRTLVNASAGS
jgi:hypothetical protein